MQNNGWALVHSIHHDVDRRSNFSLLSTQNFSLLEILIQFPTKAVTLSSYGGKIYIMYAEVRGCVSLEVLHHWPRG